MIRIRPLLALAAASLLAAPPAAAQEPRGIVFILERTAEAEGRLLAVALLGADGYEAPPSELHGDSTARAFEERWLRAGHSYEVLRHGERMGTATVAAPEREEACSEPTAGATLALSAGQAPWRGLAGEGLPAQHDAPWVRPSTPAERRVLDSLAAALFQAHGIDAAARATADTTVATLLFGEAARPVLVGSYRLRSTDPVTRQASAFIIAEEGRNGYRPAFVDFHEGLEPNHRTRSLVDAADLDADGLPDLVLENRYWKSWDYSILSRTANGWMEMYRDGGGGC